MYDRYGSNTTIECNQSLQEESLFV